MPCNIIVHNSESRAIFVNWTLLKLAFSEKATKINEIFTVDLAFTTLNVKFMVKISSIFVAFLEKMNFM